MNTADETPKGSDSDVDALAQLRACLHCSSDIPEGSKYCGECGAPVYPGRLQNFHTVESNANQIPEHLKTRIRRAKSELEDARKLVTVMFADIKGSLSIIEDHDPEDVKSILDELTVLMSEGVHRYGGLVAETTGDGIVALFGAPIADEAHAVCASHAALSIHEALETYNQDWGWDAERQPKIRIGLDSGEVIVGTIHNDLSFDYHATGVTVHMASRMEEMAKPGQTLMTAETVRLAEGLIEVEPLGPTKVKGVTQPVEAFTLRGRTSRTRFEALTLRGLSPFVGREADIECLMRAFQDVVNGDSRVVVVGGSAGVGKSRLCLEFFKRAAIDGVTVLEASAFKYGWAPYAQVAALLRSFLQVSDSDPVVTISSEIENRLRQLGLNDDCRSAFQSVLNIDVADPAWAELDPGQLRHRIYTALCSWISKLCTNGPLILFLDDLHWFDHESLAFLQHIIAEPPDSRILLVLTHRPEFENRWEGMDRCDSIQLFSLNAEGTRELIEKLVGSSESLGQLREKLANWTQGNPFFVEETIRSLIDDSILVGETGSYELSDPNPRIELAPSIESVVAARIDRLETPIRDLLRAAAAAGAQVPGDDLMAVLGADQILFDSQMLEVQKLGLMKSLQSTSKPIFAFKHAIVREVAYRGLLRGQTRKLHERILRVFESLYADRMSEKIDVLADHAYRAELWEDAAKYYMVSCRRAAARSANTEAVRALDRGLQALDNQPSNDKTTQAGIDLRLRGLASLLYLGDKERMFRLLRDAEYMARSIGDEVRLGAVNSQLATAFWVSAKHDLALEAGELALELARKHKRFALEKAALSNIATVHHMRANFGEAIRIQRGLISDFSGDLERKRFGWPGIPSVFCRAFLGGGLTFIGAFGEAVEVFETGLRIADEVEHPYSQTVIREELAYCLLWMDKNEEALALLEEAQNICSEYNMHTMYAAVAGRLALGLAACDRADEGVAIAADALEQKTFERAGRLALNYLLIGLATAYCRNDQLQDALKTAWEVEELTGAAGEPTYQSLALALIGEIQFKIGAYDEADSAYCKARDIAQVNGMRALEAQCRQGCGEIYIRQSHFDEATEQLNLAKVLYDETGLTQSSRRVAAIIL